MDNFVGVAVSSHLLQLCLLHPELSGGHDELESIRREDWEPGLGLG